MGDVCPLGDLADTGVNGSTGEVSGVEKTSRTCLAGCLFLFLRVWV